MAMDEEVFNRVAALVADDILTNMNHDHWCTTPEIPYVGLVKTACDLVGPSADFISAMLDDPNPKKIRLFFGRVRKIIESSNKIHCTIRMFVGANNGVKMISVEISKWGDYRQ